MMVSDFICWSNWMCKSDDNELWSKLNVFDAFAVRKCTSVDGMLFRKKKKHFIHWIDSTLSGLVAVVFVCRCIPDYLWLFAWLKRVPSDISVFRFLYVCCGKTLEACLCTDVDNYKYFANRRSSKARFFFVLYKSHHKYVMIQNTQQMCDIGQVCGSFKYPLDELMYGSHTCLA